MKKHQRHKRDGKVVVLIAVLMPALMGMGAFAIDIGSIELTRSQLQTGADAAALAAAEALPCDQATVDSIAQQYGALNLPAGNTVQATVEGGTWNEVTLTFTPTALSQASAIRVTLLRDDRNLYFGSLLGKSHVDISVSAIATSPGGIGSRFLIDDEMIDKDVPAIEDLADSLGRDVEELVTPRGFNQGKDYGENGWTWEDNFLDMPAGATLSLPTGQGTDYNNNDAGMFDFNHPSFPFSSGASFMKFLMYSESGNDSSKWGTDDSTVKSKLDPLKGVAPVTDASMYQSFVNPQFVHVSPVTISDTSTLNKQNGVPQVNAKGLRRGLLAFKIIAVGNDADGGGSLLPELVVTIVDPSTIDPNDVKHFSQAGNGEVKLVK